MPMLNVSAKPRLEEKGLMKKDYGLHMNKTLELESLFVYHFEMTN